MNKKGPKRTAKEIGLSLALLEQIAENYRSYYREWEQLKVKFDGTPILVGGNKQYRPITEAVGLLCDAQSRVKRRILDRFDLSDHVHGGVPGRSNITHAERHLGKKYHFVTDIKAFYPSVGPKAVREVFFQRGYSGDASRLLTRLTTKDGELPQGVSTSMRLANIAFLPVDEQLLHMCREHNITYTRYVDDLAFSSPSDFAKQTPSLIQVIRNNGFKESSRKTSYKVGPVDITGIRVFNNHLSVTDEVRQRLNELDKGSLHYIGLGEYIQRVDNTV